MGEDKGEGEGESLRHRPGGVIVVGSRPRSNSSSLERWRLVCLCGGRFVANVSIQTHTRTDHSAAKISVKSQHPPPSNRPQQQRSGTVKDSDGTLATAPHSSHLTGASLVPILPTSKPNRAPQSLTQKEIAEYCVPPPTSFVLAQSLLSTRLHTQTLSSPHRTSPSSA